MANSISLAFLAFIFTQDWSLWTRNLYLSAGSVIRVSQQTGNDTTDCWNENIPCRSLQYALKGFGTTDLQNETEYRVLIMDSEYSLTKRVQIIQPKRDGSYISIEGTKVNPKSSKTLLRCGNRKAGITLGYKTALNTTFNVQFINLEFQQCGPDLASVVLLWNSQNVSFIDCIFRNNLQAAINAIDSSVYIEKCHFINNTCNRNIVNVTLAERPFQSGVDSQSGGTGFSFENATELTVVIKDSYYFNNSAVVHTNPFYTSPAFNVTNFGEGGGGMSIVFSGKTKHCAVILEKLIFTSNKATYGGGIYLVESGTSRGNSIRVKNSSFIVNTGEQAGGGICISQWDQARSLSIVLRDCTFDGNFARRGGGVNSFFMSELGLSDSQIKISRTVAKRNVARSAAAFRFTSSLPFGNVTGNVIHLIDCDISEHRSGPHNSYSYLAPLTVQRLDIRFTGNNRIWNNVGGGGMVVENGVVHVDGTLKFTHNSASMGGGLRLWSSQIKLYPGSELLFADNFAMSYGGALYVRSFPSYQIIHQYNTDCFIAYADSFTPPSKWQTKIVFHGNSAKFKGAAIYASSLKSCIWDEEPPHYSFDRSLRWNEKTFVYDENFLMDEDGVKCLGRQYDIATDTASIIPKYQQNIKTIEMFPGETTNIYVDGLDELNHTVYTIADVLVSNITHNITENLYLNHALHVLADSTNNTISMQYFSRGRDSYESMINKTHQISISGVYSVMPVEYSFKMKSIACPPGYVFEKNSCTCDKNNPIILRCQGRYKLYLQEGMWAGVSPVTGKLLTYWCPYKYCHCHKDGPDVPGCLLDTKNLTSQCTTGRKGFLCGKCAKGLSVGLRNDECIDCKGSGWIMGVVFLIVVTLLIVIIYLNPGMSKDLRGPLFFFQVLPFVLSPRDEVGKAVQAVAYMFQFGGPFVYVWKTCIADGISNLYAIAVGYVMPLICLMIFVIAYVLSSKHIIRTKLRKTSSLQSFWLIILFMYKYLVETSLLILHCPIIDDQMVFFYDGNVQCFYGEHLLISIIALLVVVVCVLPPPIIIVLLTNGCWKVDPQYLGTLTEGLREHCPWWWSVDFVRRILIVGTYVFIPCWKTKQMWMIIMSVIVLVVHASVHPYKRVRTNVTETVYLFTLTLFAIIQTMEDKDTRDTISATLLTIATIHSGILCIIKFCRFFKKRYRCNCPGSLLKKATTRYRSFDDNSTEIHRPAVDPEVRAKQNLFDTVFASSTESSGSSDQNKSYQSRTAVTDSGEKARKSRKPIVYKKTYTG